MKYGYIRVSTKGQSRDGNSLEAQREALLANGAEKIYSDSFTGKKIDRPAFSELLEDLQEGDMLIVTKLDRFARNVAVGIEVIDELNARGIPIHVLNMGIVDNSPTGKLIRTMLLAFAEFERDMILERTREGKAVAKANNPNYREGRKKIEVDLTESQEAVRKGLKTVSQCCKELGISRRTWYNRLQAS